VLYIRPGHFAAHTLNSGPPAAPHRPTQDLAHIHHAGRVVRRPPHAHPSTKGGRHDVPRAATTSHFISHRARARRSLRAATRHMPDAHTQHERIHRPPAAARTAGGRAALALPQTHGATRTCRGPWPAWRQPPPPPTPPRLRARKRPAARGQAAALERSAGARRASHCPLALVATATGIIPLLAARPQPPAASANRYGRRDAQLTAGHDEGERVGRSRNVLHRLPGRLGDRPVD